jgi:tRNA A-37 threonylcarbamoyl transferase component Bud32
MADPISNSSNLGTLEVGSFIGGTYRVLDFIGQGGMGFVYKVEHLMMAKVLALKVLRSEQVSEDVWKRFRIEAQAIARLDHANVVRIYDMSQTEAGLPFYTMDLLVGESLADYLDEYYRLPVSEALPIFRQVCAGLAYAHDRGIIHRDIKPGNIMLLADGSEGTPSRVGPVVKIVDFGIAKLSSFDSGFGQGLTRPGEVFGSPLYMSPEQCAGQQLDHRTDMYSVGVTMFQALTGRPPLLGKTAIETTAMHQSVVPSSMADAIVLEDDEEPIVFPPELEEIVARLLEKSPDARYDSLADVASELLALERGEIRKGQGGPATVGGGRMAPYAVAEAARRKASYSKTQVLTSGQSDTADVHAENNQLKVLIVAVAVAIVLVGIVAVAAFAIFPRFQPPVKTMATTRTGSLAWPAVGAAMDQESKKSGFDDPDEPPDKLGKVDEANIESYLKEHSGFYARATTVNGQSVEIFDFPTKFSLGTLLVGKDGVIALNRKPARGRLVLLRDQNIHLNASLAVKCFPQLLKFFRPDDLCEIDLNGIKHKSPELLLNLERLTRLTRLELKETALTASDLVVLSRLHSVRDLAIDRCGLPGSSFAHCQLLPRLWGLSADGLKGVTPLLKVLSESNNLKSLSINECKIGKQDCIYLGKMTKLENLSMKDNPALTDDDIKQLISINNLQTLDISLCNGLTRSALDSLVQLKNLKVLKVPDNLSEPGCEERMRKVLKKLVVFE